ncbi:MAG TPA: YggT family protein [Rhabdochlamydiaceae bacterium]
MLILFIRVLFGSYILLLMTRIIGSWFPSFLHSAFMGYVMRLTDPYLNLFRRVIPPIGGALDLSPMLGFLVLQFLEKFLISMLLRY